MTKPVEPTRKAISDAAYVLFRRKGFHRVSLDDIAAAADVTKRTLYYHYESKDALLSAVLKAQSALELAEFQTFGVELTGTAEDIVEKLFSELAVWSAKPRWAGSGFTRLVIELADLPGHPANEIARHHKLALERLLTNLLAHAGIDLPEERSREIYLLVEGAITLLLIHKDLAYIAAAAKAAQAFAGNFRPITSEIDEQPGNSRLFSPNSHPSRPTPRASLACRPSPASACRCAGSSGQSRGDHRDRMEAPSYPAPERA